MKKVMIFGVLSLMLSSSLYADNNFIKLTIKPIADKFLSVENGGATNSIDAYSDGIGMIVSSADDKIKIDNSLMNSSVFLKGQKAKNQEMSLSDYLENESVGSSSKLQVILTNQNINPVIGTSCNDGDSLTLNDIYIQDINNNVICKGVVPRAENKCLGDVVGSEFLLNDGKSYLVVDNSTIRNNLDRASTLCTSNVSSMSYLFMFKSSFNQDISSWDVSNVTDMTGMFWYAESFNQNINSWDVSHVVYMNNMFSNAYSFNQPLNNWNTSSVIAMNSMFESDYLFNQNINSWNVSHVITMAYMFNNAILFNQPLNNWNTSKVSDFLYMFNDAYSFYQDINMWNTSKALDHTMFSVKFAENSPIKFNSAYLPH